MLDLVGDFSIKFLQVAYCLGDYCGALQLALAAGDRFQLTPRPPSSLVGSQDEQVGALLVSRNEFDISV